MPKTKTNACRLVAYYRVSTDKQGKSGLGMEAQRTLVASYSVQSGCTVIDNYIEVESGKRNDRPELAKAIAHAKRAKATLVIAKLDRLGRNVHFITGLMETGVDFVAADSPGDDRMMMQMRAVFAEEETRKISERTTAALAAYKARGGVLGAARLDSALTTETRAKGTAKSNSNQAKDAIADNAIVAPLIRQLRKEGASLRTIAAKLNSEGQTTRRDSPWSAMQVKRVLDRS